MVNVREGDLKAFGYAALEALGFEPGDARLAIDVLVEADMRGVHSHGVVRLPIYMERVAAGVVNPRPRMRRLRDLPATCVFDGDNGIGQVVGVRAMEVAIEKGKALTAPAFVAVERSNHYGAAAYFAELAAAEGMIGLSYTIGGINHMAPWGGAEPMLGNNPFAISMPTPCGFHVTLDMACSVAARGKIIVAAKTGEPIPADWALGPDGRPTTDPVEALKGLVQPLGGPKGYALTLLNGLLSTMLTSAYFGSEVTHMYEDLEREQNVGHLMGVLPIAAFCDMERYDTRMKKAVADIKSVARAPDVDEVLIPGEKETRIKERYRAEGIPLSAQVIEELRTSGRKVGVAPDDYLKCW
jgi:LDH2 family malate/lactate/ureidoglycolate dehydrogenase